MYSLASGFSIASATGNVEGQGESQPETSCKTIAAKRLSLTLGTKTGVDNGRQQRTLQDL